MPTFLIPDGIVTGPVGYIDIKLLVLQETKINAIRIITE
jgi:hypothetical protein